MNPPLTDVEMTTLRVRANGEQDGLLAAVLDELIELRAERVRKQEATERLFASVARIQGELRRR